MAGAQTKIKEVNAQSDGSFKGVDLYHEYCAVCHGKDGKGNGLAAAALKTQPTDLTTMITRRHNGKFPALEVQEYIRGDREATAAHGTAEMPVWGSILKSVSSSRGFTDLRVSNLVTYLESLQR